ncbi:uncharacterized protein LOC131429120 [Malaya genurostris]|uniref:uncharacterized protein LOC131429120 n=1 Tax=Malaya genurostris TaxID=325434 RepID=UPI0026F3F4FA|nr:uncharacterized protein LOC131429120 [Malaya genurostris]
MMDRRAAQTIMDQSAGELLERKISECIASKDWRKVINIGQASSFEERVKYLWVWPLEKDLEKIHACFSRFDINRLLSIGCGTGLLEWLIHSATGIHISGVELDERWWRSKYATKTYIPLVFAETQCNVIQGQPLWDSIMFCYFNNGPAFCEYMDNFNGKYVIIVGPRDGQGIHTDPLPSRVNFPHGQYWERCCEMQIGSENLNCIVIYRRQ